MAKKKETTDEVVKEIRDILKDKRAIIGTERTIKALRKGALAKVFLSENCPEDVTEDIKAYSRLSGTKIIKTSYPNTELGAICKKPYVISVFGVIKDASD